MSIDLSRIGELIKEKRIEKGLTIEQLAKKADVSGRTIAYWENGQKMPTVLYLDRILKALGEELKIGKNTDK